MADWEKIEATLPDYSVLLSWRWWMNSSIAEVGLAEKKRKEEPAASEAVDVIEEKTILSDPFKTPCVISIEGSLFLNKHSEVSMD